MPGPQQAPREYDRAPRQDDHADTDPSPGEHQPQEERSEGQLKVGPIEDLTRRCPGALLLISPFSEG